MLLKKNGIMRTYFYLKEFSMCGIVGAISFRDISPILIAGLKRLEYRGYDSAGLAVFNTQGLVLRRIKGKVLELQDLLNTFPAQGHIGIAHTRWATHGVPSEFNAHPHVSHEQIAVVHNGIIENHEELRNKLIAEGYQFNSETDTEVIAHLIHQYRTQGNDFMTAVRMAVKELSGAYALGILDAEDPSKLIAVRNGSPLVIGLGQEENFIASDRLALMPTVQKFMYLEEGDIALLQLNDVKIYDSNGHQVQRHIHESTLDFDHVDKGIYRHFMQKEIFEQPRAIQETLEGRIVQNRLLEGIFGVQSGEIFKKVEHIQIIACGTSYHAGLIARYWLEEFAKIPAQVEIASEYRYRNAVVQPNSLLISISQSGETADTLAAVRLAKTQGYLSTLCICNVPESSLVRESDLVFMTHAGIEIGVASTKAFTTQLVALLLLTITLAKTRLGNSFKEEEFVTQLKLLPKKIELALALDQQIEELAQLFADKYHTLFLGRSCHYPIALEGALKLKEISYIHAEAYPAGELKHGPLALVDKNMPIVAIAPNDALFEKLKSNLHEVHARGGKLIVFADTSMYFTGENEVQIFNMPQVHPIIAPIVYTIPLQLLAYRVAQIKGTDVDQPRNLAKSVTVE